MTIAVPPDTDGRALAPGSLRLIQELVNTVDLEGGPEQLVDADALRAWLLDRSLIDPATRIDAAGLTRMLELREALRALLLVNTGEPLDGGAMETLNRLAAATPLVVRLAPSGDTSLTPAASGLDGVIAAIFAIVYTAMADGSWIRLKACVRDTCQWAFYDASKNRSGHWCSMAVCGNRTKVRAYQARKRGAVMSS